MRKRDAKKMPAEKRGLRYPVEFVAAELGVDAETLRRRCEASGFKLNGAGLTFAEAYDALTQKSEDAAARRRKNIADAENSEIDTLNKKGKFMFRDYYETAIRDIAVQTRVTVERATYIPKPARARLISDLKAGVRPPPATPSNK